jgi:transposase InsO family protein
MIDAIAATRSLPWPTAPPRRRPRVVARGTIARQAVRHGVRGAIQGLCLSAAVMAAAGAVGASRGPVVLTEPGHQPTAQALFAAGVGLAQKVQWR